MEEEFRSTGIDILGEVAWGTHFCNFYATKQDLLDTLVPYFKAGLVNNEFCLWVTADPISVADATQALRQAVPNYDQYLEANSIEIVPHYQWYLEEGAFKPDRIIEGLHKKLDHVLELGYAGMRVNGNES